MARLPEDWVGGLAWSAASYCDPVHRQEAYRSFPVVDGGLPVSDALAAEVISLPMHPYLDEPTQDRIISAVRNALGRNERAKPFGRLNWRRLIGGT